LYVKITGGQRIALFGARIEMLPKIWKDLVEAGFESGQAYGKSLRTVKSCVGSSWCRFGQQDSTALAVALENRYRGLRSPHKLKSGVSGCIRECAEARVKDFGLIATEKGWNLYVCGNGGANPKHAQLLAADVDVDTAIRYLDRFLMFYIMTADKLTRTAAWLDQLEGGIEYLKRVVLDDCLGIGKELEARMEAHVASYGCDWKRALEDPAYLRRFRTFVNSDAQDESIQFETVRGQIQPLTQLRTAASKAS
jgi:nitrite reductase (NADH) large subunit